MAVAEITVNSSWECMGCRPVALDGCSVGPPVVFNVDT